MAIVINGSGTVTGISVGGLPDDIVDSGTLANDVVVSTSGAITTTGAFTSIGIDDNADAAAITIDSSENVGVGTTSPQTILSLDENTDAIIGLNRETSGGNGGDLQVRAGAGRGSGNAGGNLYLCSGTGTSSATVGKIQFGRSSGDDSTMPPDEVWMTINNTGTTDIVTGSGELGFTVYRPTTSTGGDIVRIYSDVGGTETTVGVIEANGDFQSATNSYGTTSDERIKEQITDANNQWQDVSAIRLRNFKLKNDVAENGDDALLHLGVIAQELEEAGMSGLVSENEDGVKCVKTSVMLLKALGALQEAMSRIEALTTRIETLENA
jgi:hypothetical protein